MYWALELVPKFEVYLWKRLCIIANEDIGLGNPQALLIVPSQRLLFMECREDGKDGCARLVLANTLLLMCRSPKSRLADHFQCVVNQGRLQGSLKLEIPDYAYDKHTNRGRTLKRGVDHWLDDGCRLNPVADVPDAYTEQARALWKSDKFQQTEWGKRKKKGKGEEDEQMELL